MTEADIYPWLTGLLFVLAGITFTSLTWITAPYGRHLRPGWGPSLPGRTGWLVMESPAALFFLAVFFVGARLEAVPLALLGLWQAHYVYRAFVFPFRMRASSKRIPLLIVALAVLFNVLNAYLNARWISHFGPYDNAWLSDPRFICGVVVFAAGMLVNRHSDAILLRLRKPGESDYKVPYGGLFRWVSTPNYLGELIEWIGWAVASWSLAGLGFAIYTAANLVPRALDHHRWYRDHFSNYPKDRRAILPGLL